MPQWDEPIIVGRHAFGDQYKATDAKLPAGKLQMIHTPSDPSKPPQVFDVYEFDGDGGVALCMYNTA